MHFFSFGYSKNCGKQMLEEAFRFYMHWKECLFSDYASCGTFVCQLMTTNGCFVLSQSDSFIDMEIYFVINSYYQTGFIWTNQRPIY